MSVLALDRITGEDNRSRPVTFRRTGGTLTATVPCGGAAHRVRIDDGGRTELLDHDPAGLALLRALGNTEVLPCQQVDRAALAALDWLRRRLRMTAPAGTWDETTKRWSSWEQEGCCTKHRPGWSTRQANPRPAVANDYLVEPGALLPHSRSTEHVAMRHGADRAAVDKIARWLCEFHPGLTVNHRDLPDSSAERIRALLPAEVSGQQVDNLWAMGVTLPFLEAVAEVHPSATDLYSGTGDSAYRVGYGPDYVRRVMKWWRAGVPIQWLGEVAGHARAHWPAPVRSDGYDHGSWVHRIVDWVGLDADLIGDYLAAGVRTDLGILAARMIEPEVAAEFQSVVGDGSGVRYLSSWLKDGYDVETAFEIVQAMPSAYPLGTYALRDLRKKVLKAVGSYPPPEAEMRLRAVAALVRTPGRTIKWWQTGLPLAVIAQAVEDKVSPAQALARAARG